MKQQMQEFNKDFNADGFKFDPKQMDEFKQADGRVPQTSDWKI